MSNYKPIKKRNKTELEGFLLYQVAPLTLGFVAKEGIKAIWKKVTDREVPDNPQKAGVGMRDILIWSVSTAIFKAVLKSYYKKAIDELA